MTQDPPTQKALFPQLLVLWGALLLTFLLLLHWLSAPTSELSPTPTQCSRWIGLAIEQQQIVLCLPSKPLDAMRTLTQQLKPFAYRCNNSTFPLPKHGQLLLLHPTSPPKTKATCRTSMTMLPAPQRILLGIPLPLNHASPDELAAIPRLSQRLASRIVQYRTKHGPFSSLEQLQQIRGIGPKTLQRIQPHLTLQPPP